MHKFGLLFILYAFFAATSGYSQCQDAAENLQVNGYLENNLADILDAADAVEPSKINFYGEITKSSIDRLIRKLDRAIAENENEQKEIIINMDSGGGDINHSIRAVKYIRELNRNPNIQVHTKVTSHNSCESACTILYTAGEKRFAGTRTKFGFHSPKFVRGRVDGMSSDDIEELFRVKWLRFIRDVDQTAASTIGLNRYLYDDRMSYMRGEDLETGYVTDRL
tara:strand:- start:3405 stop:4073 length:669 start_codon:yes stop_codon:yes gene_type:complete